MRRAILLAALLAGCAPAPLDLSHAKPAPEVEGIDLDGRKFRLSELRGQVVLVNHFGTWCAPCRKEMPHLVKMHAELGERGLAIVAIDHNDTLLAAKTFAHEHGIRFPVIFMNEGTNPFRVRALPTNILLDRKGQVRLRAQGFRPSTASRLRAAVETLLAEPAEE